MENQSILSSSLEEKNVTKVSFEEILNEYNVSNEEMHSILYLSLYL